MKYYSCILVALVFALTGSVYSQTNAAKIYRLNFSEAQVSDQAKMYSTHTNLSSRRAILCYFTNAPTRLTERDIVIMAIQNRGEAAGETAKFRWAILSACKISGAASFDFDCGGVITNHAQGIQHVSVLHWKSPYEDPRSLSKAEFYLDESWFGIGKLGLKKAIKEVSAKKPKYLGMAGSRYTIDSSYGTAETPFGEFKHAIHDCLKTNSVIEVLLCDEYVWAAQGEDFYDKHVPGER